MIGRSEVEDQDDDISWHRLVHCEEDRIAREGGVMRPGVIGCRWFKSPNIIPIEEARRIRQREKRG